MSTWGIQLQYLYKFNVFEAYWEEFIFSEITVLTSLGIDFQTVKPVKRKEGIFSFTELPQSQNIKQKIKTLYSWGACKEEAARW